jgi:Transposase IS116/IS110/IS902 family
MLRARSVWKLPNRKTDGLRILVTRFRGRGLPASRYDVWMPSLGPSERLLKSVQDREQHSTGGKTRLGHITKSGDTYLRSMLVLGARAVIHRVARHPDRLSQWISDVRARRGYPRATVALAAQNDRILWVLLTKGDRFTAVPA